jgi:CoA-binding domain
MAKEFPVAGGTAFQGLQTPGQVDPRQDRSLTLRSFGRIHCKTIGHLTGSLDYVLIVVGSIIVGVGYHSVILQVDVPNLMPYVGGGNIVAALFVLGATTLGNYSPSAIVSARGQVRYIMMIWSLTFLSLALFLFLTQAGPDFSRGTIISFGLLALVLLLGLHLWISATLKNALAWATISGDRAIIIGDRDSVIALSQASILQKAGAREIRRYLLSP